MRLSKTIRSCVLSLLVIPGVLLASGARTVAPPRVKFEVLSVRVLSNEEATVRSPDFIGPNVAVRLRLSPLSEGFYFYTWMGSLIPQGYKVKQSQSGTVWLYGKPGQEPMASPGVDRLTSGFAAGWLPLPPGSAIEWEELDSTSFAGEKHAFSCFVKQKEATPPVEIFSEWFQVPKNN
jgi:hypothetical protein